MTRPNESGGGGLTGATGDLTPDDADEPFVPAEWREMSDPERQGDVTTSHRRSAPSQRGDIGAPGDQTASGGANRKDGAPPSAAGVGDEFADHEDHV